MPRGKTNGINLGYRVPFIIWFPEKYKHLSPWGKAGTVTDELIDFEDLAPTMISLAGGEVPEYLKGRILIGNNRSKERNHLLLSSDRADNGPDLMRTITDGRFVYSRIFMPFMPEMRYIRYIEIADITKHMRADFKNNQLNTLQEQLFKPRPAEVLYDIDNDLWETKNLVDDSKYKAVLNTMRNQLDTDLLNARDILFAPEYEIGLISKTETPYEYRLDENKYPFKIIYDAASLSGIQGKKTIKKQIKDLKNNDKIVRYWAAIGLMSQDVNLLKPYQNKLEEALNDSYPPVSITAAAILYNNFESDKAEKVLKEFSQNDSMDLALLAINYLLYIDDKTPFIETIKKVHAAPNKNYNVKAASMDFLGILEMVENTSDTEN